MSEPTAEGKALFVVPSPSDVLLHEEKLEAFITDVVRPEISALSVDLTTKKGRDEVKSLAFKVTRTKTFLDELGTELAMEARAKVKQVDDARRRVRERFGELRDEVRKPVEEWEAKESDRIDRVAAFFSGMRDISRISEIDTSKSLTARLAALTAFALDPDLFRESLDEAEGARQDAVNALEAAIPRLKQAEADKAELASLRAFQAEKARQEAAQQAAEREVAREAQQKRDSERAAEQEALRQLEAANAALAAANAAIAAQQQQQINEAAARAANEQHRQEVIDAATKGLMTFGKLTNEQATSVVLALLSHQVPHVTLNF